MASTPEKALPSSRWTSLEDWDDSGMKERIESVLARIDKAALVRHAQRVCEQKYTMSEPFSAGQYWVCFELVGEDGSLVIARVRLPPHPDSSENTGKKARPFSAASEVETMRYVKANVASVPVPDVYAYAGPGSKEAAEAGAVYMLIEGFFGNTLLDTEFSIMDLPVRPFSPSHDTSFVQCLD